MQIISKFSLNYHGNFKNWNTILKEQFWMHYNIGYKKYAKSCSISSEILFVDKMYYSYSTALYVYQIPVRVWFIF